MGWMGGGVLFLLPLAVSTALGQPPPPQFEVPPPPQSQHASHNGPGMIDVRQPSFPAEIVVSQHIDGDWLSYAQINNHGKQDIVSVKLGWAYVMPTGLEYHSGESVPVPGGADPPRGNFYVQEQGAVPRATAKDFLDFVEEATLADGTVVAADHAQIAAFYKDCCTGAAAKAAAPEPDVPRPGQMPVAMARPVPRVNAQGLGVIPVPQPDFPNGDCGGAAVGGRFAGEREAAQPQPVELPHLPDGLGVCAAHRS